MRKRALAAVGVALLSTLTGCAGSAATMPSPPVAQAEPGGFVETDSIDGIPVTISIEPFKPGENRFVVTTDSEGIAAVETQVIMLEMGHGQTLAMARSASGRYEATSPVIDMNGKWMLRVKLTTTTGEEKLTTFYATVKPQQ